MGQQQTTLFNIRLALAGLALTCALPLACIRVEAAVERPADILPADWEMMTNLEGVMTVQHAWRIQDDRQLNALIEKGFDIHERDSQGMSYLHYCVIRNFDPTAWRVAEILISQGVDVNSRGYLGIPPLHLAAGTGNLVLVDLLLRRGADVNAVDENGRNALDFVGAENVHVASLLRNAGMKPLSANAAVVVDDLEKLEFMLSENKGYAYDSLGGPLMEIAAGAGSIQCLSSMIEFSKDKEWHEPYLASSVRHAAAANQPAALSLLLSSGFDLDLDGNRALQRAVEFGSLECIQLLAAHGLNLDERDPGGKTALHNACVDLNAESVHALLRQGANPNATSVDGGSGLHVLAQIFNQITFALSENRLDRETYWTDKTAHARRIVQLFSIAGADMNLTDSAGFTPLDRAAQNLGSGGAFPAIYEALEEFGGLHSEQWLDSQKTID